MSAADLVLLAPLAVLVAGALAVMLTDAYASPRLAYGAAIGVLGVSSALAVVAGRRPMTVAFDSIRVGGAAADVSVWLVALAALALWSGRASLMGRANGGQVAALATFSSGAAVILATADDVMVFVLALETLALCSYGLLSSAGSRRSDEAAVKYFVQGGVATAFLLYGLAVLVMTYRIPLSMSRIATMTSFEGPAVGFTLVLAAVSFKTGAFPFHWWAPDAYETSSPSVAGLLASVFKAAALVGALTLFTRAFSGAFPAWSPSVAAVAAASVVFGNLAALRQTSFRRMLAYSGIAQAGYALAGLLAPGASTSFVIVFAALYGVAALGAFSVAAALEEGPRTWDGSISGMSGLGLRRPVLAAAAAVLLLSLTGIPLTAGFWGKLLVFGALASGGWAWLALLAVLGSVVSFGYYGAVLRVMYFEGPDGERETTVSGAQNVAVTLAAATLALGVVPLFTGLDALVSLLGGG